MAMKHFLSLEVERTKPVEAATAKAALSLSLALPACVSSPAHLPVLCLGLDQH